MKAKILVVEDRPEVANTIVFLLERGGCDVATAQTGAEGIRLAQTGNFDLITLDIDLPGINGLEVCRRLKQDASLCSTPVVFISGRIYESDIHHGQALGAVDFIGKPFDALTFAQRILSHVKPKTKNQDAPVSLPE